MLCNIDTQSTKYQINQAVLSILKRNSSSVEFNGYFLKELRTDLKNTLIHP